MPNYSMQRTALRAAADAGRWADKALRRSRAAGLGHPLEEKAP